jgi:hypothetical protein
MLVSKSNSIMAMFVLLLVGGQTCLAQIRQIDDPDIASLRPRFSSKATETASSANSSTPINKQNITPQADVTSRLNQTLDSVYVKNKQVKYAQGYRILVYSGTDKIQMNQVKKQVYKLFPEIEVYTVFKQPEYRISFGDYIDKIQAHNDLMKISPSLRTALIVQEQINLRK